MQEYRLAIHTSSPRQHSGAPHPYTLLIAAYPAHTYLVPPRFCVNRQGYLGHFARLNQHAHLFFSQTLQAPTYDDHSSVHHP